MSLPLPVAPWAIISLGFLYENLFVVENKISQRSEFFSGKESVQDLLMQSAAGFVNCMLLSRTILFQGVKEIPGGRDSRRGQRSKKTKAHLEFQRLHVIGAGSEVGVDQSSTTEGPVVRDAIVLQPHAVPLTVSTVQALPVAA